jgi:hypothetical protein
MPIRQITNPVALSLIALAFGALYVYVVSSAIPACRVV